MKTNAFKPEFKIVVVKDYSDFGMDSVEMKHENFEECMIFDKNTMIGKAHIDTNINGFNHSTMVYCNIETLVIEKSMLKELLKQLKQLGLDE
jgi:hypothetical protein